MAVPKKRTSTSKKRIRRNIWRRKAYLSAVKAFALSKSTATTSFLYNKKTNNRLLKESESR